MTPPINIKNALNGQSGFFVPGSQLFSSSETANNVLAAFVGQGPNAANSRGLEEAQRRFFKLALSLFLLLATYHQLIFANGLDSDVVWEVISGAWAAYAAISADEMKEVVFVITQARRDHKTKRPAASTNLSNAVDDWIRFLNDLRNRTSGQQQPLWPPTHFNNTELGFLAHNRVSNTLQGTTTTTPGPRRDLPDRKSSPFTLRVFLCWLALSSITATSTTALYMTPIGFLSPQERRDWYEHIGVQAKILGTVHGFLEYAAGRFSQGKTTVVGVLTKWYCHPSSVAPLQNILDEEGEEVFARPVMVRHGMGIVLRLVRREATARPVVQVILFDPFYKYRQVQKRFGPWKMAVLEYRGRVMQTIIDWAQDKQISGLEIWWGGTMSMSGEPDSVEMATAFVERWADGTGFADDAATMRTLEFLEWEKKD